MLIVLIVLSASKEPLVFRVSYCLISVISLPVQVNTETEAAVSTADTQQFLVNLDRGLRYLMVFYGACGGAKAAISQALQMCHAAPRMLRTSSRM